MYACHRQPFTIILESGNRISNRYGRDGIFPFSCARYLTIITVNLHCRLRTVRDSTHGAFVLTFTEEASRSNVQGLLLNTPPTQGSVAFQSIWVSWKDRIQQPTLCIWSCIVFARVGLIPCYYRLVERDKFAKKKSKESFHLEFVAELYASFSARWWWWHQMAECKEFFF